MGNDAQISRVFTSRNETRAFYDKISEFYDLLADHSEAPIRAAAIELLAAQRSEHVLEIGSGTGHCLPLIARAVGRSGGVVSIDLSERMLRRARALVLQAGIREEVNFICGDAIQLPLRSGTLDAVLTTFTLELFDTPDIMSVLHECRRVLRPNGRIVVAGISKEGPGGIVVDAYEWSHRHFPNFVDCRPIFVSRALESVGFQVVQKVRKEMWLPVEIVLARASLK